MKKIEKCKNCRVVVEIDGEMCNMYCTVARMVKGKIKFVNYCKDCIDELAEKQDDREKTRKK